MKRQSKIAHSRTDLAGQEVIAPCESAAKGSPDPGREPLPRPQRRQHRSKADRGLPVDDELTKLAKAFLERQRQGWPKLAAVGLFPEPTPEVLAQMVADFKQRHRSGNIDIDLVRRFTKFGAKLAGIYNRYSCENSSPLSVLDQMINSLDRAQADGRLVLWQYVFADYSVTGLDASRQGYSSYKKILNDPEQLIETTYIDDFTRASRDALEWWKLAALSKRISKRMIGASDGFDLGSPDWDIKITIYGLLSRLFIKGLREKVKRGMSGAARRGTCLGRLSLGFTRRAHCDQQGEVVLDHEGRPVYEPCIDPETRDARVELYKMFVERNMSAYEIAREFNRRKVDGWGGWSEGSIKGLLRSPDAIGVFIWNKTRSEYDYEREKLVAVRNPHAEWHVRYAPELAIVPTELWRAARRKLAAMRRASPRTGKKLSRNQVSATTLFSGTLFCEYCGAELKLNRSASKYKVSACLNGLTGAHDCRLSTSKSTRIIEEGLLGYLRNTILTEVHLDRLVTQANEHLMAEAQKPQVDTKPWRAELKRLQSKVKKFVLLIENEEDQELCVAHNERAKDLQREAIALQTKIRNAEGTVRAKVKPLSKAKAREYLDRLRETLNADIPVAAAAIRAITGPIQIRQEIVPGRPGARWIATFSPDLLRAVRFLADGNLGPMVAAHSSGDAAKVVEVVLDKVPKYESLAPLFKQLHDDGASINTIASAHGLTWEYVNEVLKFATTGERPNWKSGKGGGKGKRNETRYVDLAPQVVELRDKQKLAFKQIAKQLKVRGSTVLRAYDYGRPDAVRTAAQSGQRPVRGACTRPGEAKQRLIRKLLQAGKKPNEIAKKVKCGLRTVYRVKQQLNKNQDDSRSA